MPMQVLSDATTSPAVTARQCATEILDGIPEVMWMLRCHMRKRRAKGLSVPQFRALCLIKQTPDGSLSAVADHLGSTLPTASRIVAGLVTRGLVSRKERSDDRRAVSLQLTTKGKSILDFAREGTSAAVAERLVGLTQAQRQTISASVALMVGTLGRAACDPTTK